MGCDIHLWVEKNIDGKWVKQYGMVSDYYKEKDSYFGTEEFKNTDQPYSGRNYALFAVLADVRNDYLEFKEETSKMIPDNQTLSITANKLKADDFIQFRPIDFPRGVPKDASPEYKEEAEGWGGDGHSHSYFSLYELKNFDWNREFVQKGYINEKEFLEFEETGKPSSWCGGTSAEIVPYSEMKKYVEENLEKIKEIKAKWYFGSKYTYIVWKDKIGEYAEHFKNHMFPILEKFSEDGKGHDVRIVFFFDN